MRSVWVCAAALCALAWGDVGAAAPRPSVVTNPDWLETPNVDDMAEHFPKAAIALGITGRATLSCVLDSYGALERCEVINEGPPGLGFGEAALAIKGKFRMKPKAVDGRQVEGGTVRIPIRFVLPEAKTTRAPTVVASPQALAAARRVVELAHPVLMRASDVAAAPKAARLASPGVDAATIEAVRAAYVSAGPLVRERALDAVTGVYATTFSLPELQAFNAFLATRAGRALITGEADSTKKLGVALAQSVVRIVQQTRTNFCAARDCEAAPTPADLRKMDAFKAVVESPEWSERPTGGHIYTVYPSAARIALVGGWAQLGCKVDHLGLLSSCAVIMERPKDLGFGAAALSMAPRYRLAPRLMAQGAAGESVAVTVNFPTLTAPDSALPPPPPPPLSRSLDLARDLVAEEAETLRQMRGRMAEGFLDGVVVASPAAAETEARRALSTAFDANLPIVTDAVAQAYTETFTEQELQQLLAFRRSPAGVAWASKRSALYAAISQAMAAASQAGIVEARKTFCATRKCETS